VAASGPAAREHEHSLSPVNAQRQRPHTTLSHSTLSRPTAWPSPSRGGGGRGGVRDEGGNPWGLLLLLPDASSASPRQIATVTRWPGASRLRRAVRAWCSTVTAEASARARPEGLAEARGQRGRGLRGGRSGRGEVVQQGWSWELGALTLTLLAGSPSLSRPPGLLFLPVAPPSGLLRVCDAVDTCSVQRHGRPEGGRGREPACQVPELGVPGMQKHASWKRSRPSSTCLRVITSSRSATALPTLPVAPTIGLGSAQPVSGTRPGPGRVQVPIAESPLPLAPDTFLVGAPELPVAAEEPEEEQPVRGPQPPSGGGAWRRQPTGSPPRAGAGECDGQLLACRSVGA